MNTDTRITPYPLRLGHEIRAKLEAVAKVNGRSLNAEIAMRLIKSLQEEEESAETKPKKRDDREYALDFISVLYKADPALAVEIVQGKHDLSDIFWRKPLRDVIQEELVSLLKEKGLLGKVEG